jgi:hypothetical protein
MKNKRSCQVSKMIHFPPQSNAQTGWTAIAAEQLYPAIAQVLPQIKDAELTQLGQEAGYQLEFQIVTPSGAISRLQSTGKMV